MADDLRRDGRPSVGRDQLLVALVEVPDIAPDIEAALRLVAKLRERGHA
jgi:hypothetical protein